MLRDPSTGCAASVMASHSCWRMALRTEWLGEGLMMASFWVFPKIGVPQIGWFIMEHPIEMDDLVVPLFLETPIYGESSWWSHFF